MLLGYRQFHCIDINRWIYKDIAEDVQTRFDTSDYELNRPLPKRKKNKTIGRMKDELGERIMKEFLGLRAKTYSYLIDSGSENKNVKGTKMSVIEKANKLENKINHLEKNEIDVQ